MKIAIHQPNYLPWLGFFNKMAKADVFIILDTAQFTKNNYQNRVKIKTPQGAKWLTQPVSLADEAFRPTNLIQFADQSWGEKHIKTIQANYGRSNHFKAHFDLLSSYLKDPCGNLAEFNLKLIRWAAEAFGIKTAILLASGHPSDLTGTARLIELVKWSGGKIYLSGKGGVNYQNPELFEKAGIDLEIIEYRCKPYPQLWGEFVAGLSVIDLIFNCGAEGKVHI